ncbi:MAG TPA: carboxypeptidase M32 [Azospirillaceae bacterium]|nr:carboxypeptidase M32 [Azospirillaceae bacterium]
MTAYQDLERRFARLSLISDAQGILGWDTQTMMPDGSAEGRAEQTATLSLMSHELLTDPRVGAWLDAAEAEADGLDGWQRANLAEMRRGYVHATAIPPDLVEASSKASSACEMVWRTARADSDFKALLPSLREVLRCQRETGAALGAVLGLEPYDALLDTYEPGGRSARIDALFDDLASFLPGFLARVVERQAQRPAVAAPEGPFPVATQKDLGLALMKAIGFDFTRGRLDVSLHPFCGGATGDVRITTRYEEDNFTRALMGVMHETGHAVYEQNRPAAWLRQPVGSARGMGMHESQSLIVEMQAGRSRPFIDYLAPVVRDAFNGGGPAWESGNLYRLYTVVRPSFIRVDADEVTYPAHVILRYRLEKALIRGEMDLEDLPAAWNAGMRELLGITPPDDRRGCLQDIHWPGGGWGYFPTYTLGAMTAAQLFDAACRAEPGLLPALGRGDFAPLMGWLKVNVHEKASRYSSDEVLTWATGQPLNAAVYKTHLTRRYLEG